MESGHTPSRKHPEYWGGNVPWISIADAKRHHGRTIYETVESTNEVGLANSSSRLLPAGTVCLSRTASVGYVIVMGRDMATSQDFVNWVCSPALDPRFLQYLLLAEGEDILRFASGSVHQTIYFPEAKAFHVCYPQLAEQQRIVGILDEAFAGIGTAKVNAEKNVRNARALFDSHVAAVFAAKGEGWVEKRLDEIGKTQTGSTPSTAVPENFGDFVPFIKPADFCANGSLDYARDGLSARGLAEARPVGAGSVLMVCIGATIGKCGYCERDITTNQQVNALIPFDHAPVNHKLLYFQMTTDRFQQQVLSNSAQATLPIINKGKWGALTLALPRSIDKQNQLAAKMEALCDETKRLESLYQQKLAALDALKNSLLHQAFSGRFGAHYQ